MAVGAVAVGAMALEALLASHLRAEHAHVVLGEDAALLELNAAVEASLAAHREDDACGRTRLGAAWRGMAWRGVAWRGVAWRGVV